MAHDFILSTRNSMKEQHLVSLKVLRLSRPTVASQYSLSEAGSFRISPKALSAYPSRCETGDQFILSPVLDLPAAFGNAYLGETFSCTLCVNNEIDTADTHKMVGAVKVQADMQTPSSTIGSPLDLSSFQEQAGQQDRISLGPSESLQKILKFDLKEEGNHVLVVTITYTEVTLNDGKEIDRRDRTFRKLYQFIAQQLFSVRTKAGQIQEGRPSRYLLEAQLENMGEAAICLEAVAMNPKSPFTSTALNQNLCNLGSGRFGTTILNSHDVVQVAFLLEPAIETDEAEDQLKLENKKILGQLAIRWRSAMGDLGCLNTSWLTA